ncbi:MAG: MFS transporter [Deltaproteobacteria bacterium]|nr:MFS transporter [Deltaproteobacteria bacterium]
MQRFGTSSIWPACYSLIFCVTAFSASQGLTYPLLSLVMERSGEPASAIALNAAMTPLGIIASAPIINRHAHRFSTGVSIATAIGLTIVTLLLIGWFSNPLAWLPLRLFLGCTVNVVYVLSEATLLTVAPPSHRGRLMGAYTCITNAGYALGPLLLTVAGSTGSTAFLLLSAFLMTAMAPFLFIVVDRPSAVSGAARAR